MIRIEDSVKVGKLGKSHGTRGAFNLTLDDAFFEDEIALDYVLLHFEGYLVPFFIEELKLTDPKNGTIKFDHINKPEDTREFINCDIYVSHEDLETKSSGEINNLTGFAIIDRRYGHIGIVSEVDFDSPNPLIIAIHNNRELYIPFHENIIQSIDAENQSIITEVPDGLININD